MQPPMTYQRKRDLRSTDGVDKEHHPSGLRLFSENDMLRKWFDKWLNKLFGPNAADEAWEQEQRQARLEAERRVDDALATLREGNALPSEEEVMPAALRARRRWRDAPVAPPAPSPSNNDPTDLLLMMTAVNVLSTNTPVTNDNNPSWEGHGGDSGGAGASASWSDSSSSDNSSSYDSGSSSDGGSSSCSSD